MIKDKVFFNKYNQTNDGTGGRKNQTC